jgi:hypothetical protein
MVERPLIQSLAVRAVLLADVRGVVQLSHVQDEIGLACSLVDHNFNRHFDSGGQLQDITDRIGTKVLLHYDTSLTPPRLNWVTYSDATGTLSRLVTARIRS